MLKIQILILNQEHQPPPKVDVFQPEAAPLTYLFALLMFASQQSLELQAEGCTVVEGFMICVRCTARSISDDIGLN